VNSNPPGRNPIVGSFDGLLGTRDLLLGYVAQNPGDLGGLFAKYCAINFMNSHGQLLQDLFALFMLKGKRNGFFVEFGATNGSDLSNTWVLEHHFGWRGILAEPATVWHAALRANRKAAIDTRCVWSRTGERLEFSESDVAELSTLANLVEGDFNRAGRVNAKTYAVETVSLNDLLRTHNAPREIDFMSVDTEGSEGDILKAFDFRKYDVKVMTVEHNFVEPKRGEIHDLLTANGFVRMFEALSKFDDWYVKRSLVGL
jgi:FkbM family methyltransferase